MNTTRTSQSRVHCSSLPEGWQRNQTKCNSTWRFWSADTPTCLAVCNPGLNLTEKQQQYSQICVCVHHLITQTVCVVTECGVWSFLPVPDKEEIKVYDGAALRVTPDRNSRSDSPNLGRRDDHTAPRDVVA